MRRLLQVLLAFVALCVLLVAVGAASFYALIVRDLPRVQSLRDYTPKLGTRILSAEGEHIGELFEEHRVVVAIEEMPEYLVKAFIAAEDDAFYRHEGLDYAGIVRAALANLRAGGVKQGGSTITQQVAKTLLLSADRTFVRKLKDMILARRIEQSLDKNEILYLYLNQIYLGAGAHGVEAAARVYFEKPVGELSLGEAAMIAGLVPAPSVWNPFQSLEHAKRRQAFVLRRMREQGFIDDPALRMAELEKLSLARGGRLNDVERAARSYVEEVRRYLVEHYGNERVLTGGLEVKTALSVDAQLAAWEAVRAGLRDLDRRRGYRGPVREIARAERAAAIAALHEPDAPPVEPGALLQGLVVEVDDTAGNARVALAPDETTVLDFESFRWARKEDPTQDGAQAHISRASQALREGWLIELERLSAGADGKPRYALHQEPKAEAALFSLDVATGRVDAMIGGYDYERSEFNRALQMRRQPGSAFKPIIYAAAIEKGYTPATIVHDTPIVYEDATGLVWKPENYTEQFYGPITLREALAHSRNIATIKILSDVGIPSVVELGHALGIEGELAPNLSLALGTSEVTLAELVKVYATFAAGGRRVEPIFILEVRDRDGAVLEANVRLPTHGSAVPDVGQGSDGPVHRNGSLAGSPPSGYVFDPVDAFLMTDLLRAVVEEGTGSAARALGRPIAGKTGTTNDLFDAWFIGYAPQKAAGAWIGFDALQPLGVKETGGRAAAPIFVNYMRKALAQLPVLDFERPSGVVFARIDRKSGLLTRGDEADALFQPFREGTVPAGFAPDRAVSDGELVTQPTRLD